MFGQEDEDFSGVDWYLLCHGRERVGPFLPSPVALPPGLWMEPLASHTLMLCGALECGGGGLISL